MKTMSFKEKSLALSLVLGIAALSSASDLPALLVSRDGTPIRTVEDWEKIRRPQVEQVMLEEVFGVRPVERPKDLRFEVLKTECALGGKAVRKLVRGKYSGPGGEGSLVFSAWIPATPGPHPAFVHLSPRPAENADDLKGPRPEYTLPVDYIVGRGYAAVAVCDYDSAEDWWQGQRIATNGVFRAFGPADRDKRGDRAWGILSAWAWGASRVMDWIETEPSLAVDRVAVVGLSRNGKAALVAGATDRRFALTVSCCSGMGGAKLNHMENPGSETVKDILIARRWFSPRFEQWSGRDRQMPFDMHGLLSLVAPRLLYVSSATEDAWAGPRGEFASVVHASEVWNLYRKQGIVQREFPPPDSPLHDGSVGYHVRAGAHAITAYDWQCYLDYTDAHGWRKTMKIQLLDKTVDLGRSEVLAKLSPFDPSDWKLVKHAPKWTVTPERICGGGPNEPTHGQIFYSKPFFGDVIMEFDARIIPPSYHDIVWFWNTRFEAEPWSAGYLGCLGGWWSNQAGIEKLPDYIPSAIAPSHETKPGVWYHIVSGSCGSAHFIVVDGRLVTYFSDAAVPDSSRPGYIGFGIYESHVEYRNLIIRRPHWTPRNPRYVPGEERNREIRSSERK